VTARRLAEAGQLFDEDFFTGWYLANGQVYDLAEEWLALEESAPEGLLSNGMERLLERFCQEQLQPHIPQIVRRLELNADLLALLQRDRELVELTLVVAESLRSYGLPCHRHPFLRRFAMESLLAAREALSEGYDLRDHPEDEDEDWE
jgi:chromosome condensin MukBEF complex kleisin-like MukF subunit